MLRIRGNFLKIILISSFIFSALFLFSNVKVVNMNNVLYDPDLVTFTEKVDKKHLPDR